MLSPLICDPKSRLRDFSGWPVPKSALQLFVGPALDECKLYSVYFRDRLAMRMDYCPGINPRKPALCWGRIAQKEGSIVEAVRELDLRFDKDLSMYVAQTK